MLAVPEPVANEKIDYLQTSFQELSDAASKIFQEAQRLETTMMMPEKEEIPPFKSVLPLPTVEEELPAGHEPSRGSNVQSNPTVQTSRQD